MAGCLAGGWHRSAALASTVSMDQSAGRAHAGKTAAAAAATAEILSGM